MSFTIMLELAVHPDWITSEPSEHSIALMLVLDGNLKIMCTTEASRYIATAHHEKCKKTDTMFHSGPIQIETDLAVIEAQKGI
eukprot:5818518-Ditylum_brightwellii.AAC.1